MTEPEVTDHSGEPSGDASGDPNYIATAAETRAERKSDIAIAMAQQREQIREEMTREKLQDQHTEALQAVVHKQIAANEHFKGAPKFKREQIEREAADLVRARDDFQEISGDKAKLRAALAESTDQVMQREADWSGHEKGIKSDDVAKRVESLDKAGESGGGHGGGDAASTKSFGEMLDRDIEYGPHEIEGGYPTEAALLSETNKQAVAFVKRGR